MLTITRLRRKPHHFYAFTGLTVEQFDRLFSEMEPVYQAFLHAQRERPGRQRAIGGGRGFALSLPDRLLLGLIYLRQYVTLSLLSYLFDLAESNISRELHHRLMPVLHEVLPVPLRDAPLRWLCEAGEEADPTHTSSSPKRKRRINTLEELLRVHPELAEVLLDATEQEVPKPKDKQARKQRYSGKHKQHTVKTQVVTTHRLVLHVFGGLPGSLHDTILLRASGAAHQMPHTMRLRIDTGYEGAQTEYPHTLIVKPVRAQRNHKLTVLGRAYNRMVSRFRMPVEHMLSRLQKYKVLAGLWRGRWEEHESVFCLVSGLINYKAAGKFALADCLAATV